MRTHRAAHVLVAVEHGCNASDDFSFHRANVRKDIGVQRIGFAEQLEHLRAETCANHNGDCLLGGAYSVVDDGGILVA